MPTVVMYAPTMISAPAIAYEQQILGGIVNRLETGADCRVSSSASATSLTSHGSSSLLLTRTACFGARDTIRILSLLLLTRTACCVAREAICIPLLAEVTMLCIGCVALPLALSPATDIFSSQSSSS